MRILNIFLIGFIRGYRENIKIFYWLLFSLSNIFLNSFVYSFVLYIFYNYIGFLAYEG
jgi:hypothetical protein